VSEYLNFLKQHKDLIEIAEASLKTGGVRMERRPDGHLDFVIYPGKITSPKALRYLQVLYQEAQGKFPILADAWNYLNVMLYGPKIYRPSLEECEALEEVELKLPVSAYSQPFPTFIIEFPKEYREDRSVIGEVYLGMGQKAMEQVKPYAISVCHNRESASITTSILVNTSQGTSLASVIGAPDAKTIEDDLAKRLVSSMQCHADEILIQKRCTRIALNACLMLTDRGMRQSKGEEDKVAQRLRDKIEKSKRKGEHVLLRKGMQEELRMVPLVYEFTQEVNIRKIVGSRDACVSLPTGRQVRPHWRSAHWRMQAHGVGLTQHKRIFVPHVMVNKHYFFGKEGDTQVVQK
jgi:hypothetical protein